MRKTKPLKVRFEAKYRVTPGCWIWTGSIGGSGYGQFNAGPHHIMAHRLSFSLYKGSIAAGMHILHRCDNRLCVNPDHLFLGTRQDNMDDMVRKGRSTRGENHPGCKLTEAQVRAIDADTRSHSSIAKDHGVRASQVTRIKNRQRWAYLFNESSAA